MKHYCKEYYNHEKGQTCECCKLEVDQYGNTEEDFINCTFPDCGCDGARLCMAGAANPNANECNVEGMYQRNDKEALQARAALLYLVVNTVPPKEREDMSEQSFNLALEQYKHDYELWWDQKGKYWKCHKCGAVLGQDSVLCSQRQEPVKDAAQS